MLLGGCTFAGLNVGSSVLQQPLKNMNEHGKAFSLPGFISFNALMSASFKSDSGAQVFLSGVITAGPMRRRGGRGRIGRTLHAHCRSLVF